MDIVILYYYIAVNIYGFLLMGFDKWKAKRGKYRIAERHLFISAFLGGALGCIIGMQLFRHKIRKGVFRYGMPLLFVVHLMLSLNI
ncbi:DUF1294 domain-containing protein [Salirhabdus salicampi]|uniref:DUF1294 domain-containing protein n=1 Tax=Salirhabdus salicampi TaxID=476102 RepID=UPI0020C53911|nr:DUF1294 domain-containing protein [Salirhabdus salicampi]MCP8617072.1 DUF1294 domain-containing protein [Salirhabdus salicampi]